MPPAMGASYFLTVRHKDLEGEGRALYVWGIKQKHSAMSRPTLQQAKDMMTAKGYTPSKSSFDEGGRLYVFSVEASTPGTFGHPDAIIEYKYGRLTETYTEVAKAKKRLLARS